MRTDAHECVRVSTRSRRPGGFCQSREKLSSPENAGPRKNILLQISPFASIHKRVHLQALEEGQGLRLRRVCSGNLGHFGNSSLPLLLERRSFPRDEPPCHSDWLSVFSSTARPPYVPELEHRIDKHVDLAVNSSVISCCDAPLSVPARVKEADIG